MGWDFEPACEVCGYAIRHHWRGKLCDPTAPAKWSDYASTPVGQEECRIEERNADDGS